MAVSYSYALCPFDWIPPSENRPGYHARPSGVVGHVDLRSNTQAAVQGPSGGFAFCAFSTTPPAHAVILGTGDCREIQADATLRNKLKTTLSLPGNPAGATMVDCVADAMNSMGDPAGVSGPKPIMPDKNGSLVMHMGGHSPIWSARLDIAELLSANPRGHANRIRDVIRADLDAAEAYGRAPLLRKALGAVLMKCGYTREELKSGASGKAAEWQRLLSASVKAKHGGNARPDKPDTSFSEAFPNDTAGLAGSSQDQSWTTPTYALAVVSGAARGTLAGNNCWGICGSAVSSADHITYCDTTSGTGYIGPASRVASTGMTGYIAMRTGVSNQLWKVVANAFTALSGVATGAGTRFACRSSGSTQTLSSTGQSPVAVTDTAITGNLLGGLYIYPAGTLSADTADNWMLDDELGGGGGGGSSRNPSSLGMLGVG